MRWPVCLNTHETLRTADSGDLDDPTCKFHSLEVVVKTFASFDGATIAYHDEGEGSPVILLHGYGVDGLGQFGSFERILPLGEANININYAYCGLEPGTNAPLVFLAVADVGKAASLLEQRAAAAKP